MYILNNKDPKTEPSGTPDSAMNGDEKTPEDEHSLVYWLGN
jgi:hypothetical protein